MLPIVRALGKAVNVLLVAPWWAVFFVPQFCGPFNYGHEFGLMVAGDECACESVKVEAVQIWKLFWRTDFRNVFDVTSRNPWTNLKR